MPTFYSKMPITNWNYVDSTGAPISGVRMDASKAYAKIPELLQKFINNNDISAWIKITDKIDYIYSNLNYALAPLDEETDFKSKIKYQISLGKKLLFKPNLVAPFVIDAETHGEGPGAAICTEWPLMAALMRWFHDKLNISYFQMAIGEAASFTFAMSYSYSKIAKKNITTEAVMEGRSSDFYGGWGFFFARKYLKEHHPASHKDNPMNGYEDSISGRFLPPGKAGNRLMVYDLNKIQDDITKGRTVTVPGGVNFKEITLHKVIVGGDPQNNDDLRNYPGCVLINVPKTKMHAQDLITNAIKNIGIGLYPSQCAIGKDKNDTTWKYACPNTANPILKAKLPHSPWVLSIDSNTNLPIRDKNGKYIAAKTAGMSGTQADVIRAVQNQNVFMLHIVDAINIINISHNNYDGASVRVPEGYVWASLDCVALDLFCARYCFKTLPMCQALKLKEKNNWPTEFVHHVPAAKINGRNISSIIGFDSPLFRYNLYHYAEERGIGQQNYHVMGRDLLTKTPLASLKGHLVRISMGKFFELMTHTLYYNPSTILHNLQLTILSYAKACDKLTGSSLYKDFMKYFDENHDGIIDFDEKARGYETAQFQILSYASDIKLKAAYGSLKGSFIEITMYAKNSNKNYNHLGHDFTKEKILIQGAAMAFAMSQSKAVKKDLFVPGMSYGNGMWPSWQTVLYMQTTSTIYGSQSSKDVTLNSLYGTAFQYADKVLNDGAYTKSIDEMISDPKSINKYIESVSAGAAPLNFTLYVPMGYGKLSGVNIPNVVETEDPKKIYTAHFNAVW
ncbi:DUF362 domain-containing protein [Clostridium autoethanogenum]|uniref:EF-hand domain-containing protein n=2 Tax=Clostridium TaxID=1485 RepID=A0A1A6AVY5_9CLOT|nr:MULTISPECIES: DUF362 domain-containing protein [Clostridium]OBR94198.1 hypothetical protein CLRAG_15890 [Clostridium ragsdalei P11]RMD01036.1 DUF362 domain-containing protein [Clostridium autoethanogenum]